MLSKVAGTFHVPSAPSAPPSHSYRFTVNWTTHHFPWWRKWLGHLIDRPITGCEIGSFEGRSAVFFLSEIVTHPDAKLVCIDPWDYEHERHIVPGGGDAYMLHGVDLHSARANFDHNVRPWRERVIVYSTISRHAIACQREASLDFAYIDGSHLASAALEDAVLIWPKLRPGGTLIWDDYDWTGNSDPPPGWTHETMRPKLGIDAFLSVYHGQYTDLEIEAGQVKIRNL